MNLLFLSLSIALCSQGQIERAKLEQHVQVLANDSLFGRMTGTEGNQKAADYISGVMREIGLKPYDSAANGYLVPWSKNADKKEFSGNNIAGMIPGNQSPDSMIIFSAHYDHIGVLSAQKALPFRTGYKRVKGDSIFNGANDNASGVSAMLELARAFKEARPAFTLMFVAFSGEEFGLFGSEAFARQIDPKLVKLNINLEMLGRPGKSKPYLTEPEDGSGYLQILNENLGKSGLGYSGNYFEKDPYPAQELFTRSDNYPFYQAGIPAYTIMGTSPYDKYYHSAADHAETLEFDAMTEMVKAIYAALLPLVKPADSLL
jgi:Zn-dependent M28 family amino/carboxypeptidase